VKWKVGRKCERADRYITVFLFGEGMWLGAGGREQILSSFFLAFSWRE
jgi:hypothetical protein